MKRLLVAAVLLLAACSDNETGSTTAQGPTTKAPTAHEFIESFKQRGLPVGKVVCYDGDTDPNNLLGRPGGYIEKCDWADTREKQPHANADYTDPDSDFDLIGGSIETYEEPSGAAMRAEELRAFEGGILSTGYTFNGLHLHAQGGRLGAPCRPRAFQTSGASLPRCVSGAALGVHDAEQGSWVLLFVSESEPF
jgi:hypothetical protein